MYRSSIVGRNTDKNHSEFSGLNYKLFKTFLYSFTAHFQILPQRSDEYYRNLLLLFLVFTHLSQIFPMQAFSGEEIIAEHYNYRLY